MIARAMREYGYKTYSVGEYGQSVLSAEIQGTVKMAIYETSTSIQDNINFAAANYMGITSDPAINDNCVVIDGDNLLKVLYCINKGRKRQIFMVKL